MKLEEFKEIVKRSRYLFHLHTRYTDGHLDMIDYFNFCEENNLSDLIFTEHVRKELKYSFKDFANEIKEVSKDFPSVNPIIGAEAKVLPGGDLDICEEVLENVDLICFACHGFPDDVKLYADSFKKLFSDARWKKFARVFVHPGRFLLKRDIIETNIPVLKELIDVAAQNNVIIEDNKRENLPGGRVKLEGYDTIIGFDIHNRKGLSDFLAFHEDGSKEN